MENRVGVRWGQINEDLPYQAKKFRFCKEEMESLGGANGNELNC